MRRQIKKKRTRECVEEKGKGDEVGETLRQGVSKVVKEGEEIAKGAMDEKLSDAEERKNTWKRRKVRKY